MTGCVFCEIVAGERPADVVFEDEFAVAFLDARPVFEGHTLLVPRLHVPTIEELPDDLMEPLFVDARVLARAVREAMGGDGSFVAVNNVVSQSVPHMHVHIVPRRFHDGLRGFFWPRQRYADDAERIAVRDAVRAVAERIVRGG